MLGVFGDHDMSDQRLGRQAALDEPRLRLRLGNTGAPLGASIFRADRHLGPIDIQDSQIG